MSIHSIDLPPGVDIADVIAREEYGEESYESQDNVAVERQERREADAVYWRTIRREKLKNLRRNASRP